MLKMKVLTFSVFSAIVALGIFVFSAENTIVLSLTEEGEATSTAKIVEAEEESDPNADLPRQKPLGKRPDVIKAIYSTSWSAGSQKKVNYFMELLRDTELNAIVIDIKDYTGVISYKTDIEEVESYGASENRIPKINALIKKFHDEGVYLIARISVFQDTKLAYARPDLALKSSSTAEVWTDRKKVAWVDSASQEVWDYNIKIAKDVLDRGFDEVNFDYVRFATDGNLKDIVYPFFDPNTLKSENMRKFFAYVGERIPKGRASVDLFGLVTVNTDDLGIGQVMEHAFAGIDYIAPMTYPSHYAKGFNGIENPAAAPYEVMKYSIDRGLSRMVAFRAQAASSSRATGESAPAPKMRPWIQDFDLGADYTAQMVRAQIQAIEDAARVYSGCESLTKVGQASGESSDSLAQSKAKDPRVCSELVDGWMLWNPSNIYTKEALLLE